MPHSYLFFSLNLITSLFLISRFPTANSPPVMLASCSALVEGAPYQKRQRQHQLLHLQQQQPRCAAAYSSSTKTVALPAPHTMSSAKPRRTFHASARALASACFESHPAALVDEKVRSSRIDDAPPTQEPTPTNLGSQLEPVCTAAGQFQKKTYPRLMIGMHFTTFSHHCKSEETFAPL